LYTGCLVKLFFALFSLSDKHPPITAAGVFSPSAILIPLRSPPDPALLFLFSNTIDDGFHAGAFGCLRQVLVFLFSISPLLSTLLFGLLFYFQSALIGLSSLLEQFRNFFCPLFFPRLAGRVSFPFYKVGLHAVVTRSTCPPFFSSCIASYLSL